MLGPLHATHSRQPRRGLGYMCGIQGARHTQSQFDQTYIPSLTSIIHKTVQERSTKRTKMNVFHLDQYNARNKEKLSLI